MLTLPQATGRAIAGIRLPRGAGDLPFGLGFGQQISPAKRCFDIALGLALAGPVVVVCVLVGLALLMLQGRPILHMATRMTDPVRQFRLVKFRTMAPDAGDAGVTGGHKAARITPVGAWLRRHRLDELPQLWNILAGDMSFVGPRPPLPSVVASQADVYRRVLRLRPGITGLATVMFHRHEERLMQGCETAAEAEDIYARRCILRKARLDGIYERNRGLGFDLAILVLTVVPCHSRYRILARCGRVFRTRLTKKTAILADDPRAGRA